MVSNMKYTTLSICALLSTLSATANTDFGEMDGGENAERQAVNYTPEIIESIEQLYHDKIGLFIHWGPYAQLGGVWKDVKKAEWIMANAKIPVAEYEEHAAKPFNPTEFNAAEWVELAKEAGMGFIAITSKHHDGFAMYDSEHPYNITDFGEFGRDPLMELHEESQKQGIRFGVYYSQSQDWHEEGAVGNTWEKGWRNTTEESFAKYYRSKALPQIKELVTRFDPLYMIWFDTPGNFITPELIEETMEMVNDIQPNVLMNSRIGGGYGHFQTAIDHGMMPAVNTEGWIDGLKVPWQTHDSVSGPWGYASHKPQFHEDPNRSVHPYIYTLADIVSKGGVLLLNIAPDETGVIPIGQANVLRRLGKWLDVHGEAIYDADPSPIRNPDLPITSKPGKLFFHVQRQSESKVEVKGILTTIARAYLLNDPTQSVPFTQDGDLITFELPNNTFEGTQGVSVIAADYVGEMAISDPTLTPDANGVIKLPVSKSRYTKIRMSFDKKFGSTHKLAMPWDTGGNTIIWDMRVTEPGTYKVVSHQAFAPGLEGARYSVRVNDQVLEADPVVTKHGRDFSRVELGTITFDQPGDYELRMVMLDGARNSGSKRDKSRYIREFSLQSIELRKQ